MLPLQCLGGLCLGTTPTPALSVFFSFTGSRAPGLPTSICPCLCLICLILGCFIGKPTKYQTYSYSARDAQHHLGQLLPVPCFRQGGSLHPVLHLLLVLTSTTKPVSPSPWGLRGGVQSRPGGWRRFGMAAVSTLATCPPAHARDDDNTKARGPVPSTASTALAWGGYLWRCSHCSGPLVSTVPSCVLTRVPGASTRSLSRRSLDADPFSPQDPSLGGSNGSLPWEILTNLWSQWDLWASCAQSVTTCPENSSLPLGNLFLQLPTAFSTSAPSTSMVRAGLRPQWAPGGLCPWCWVQSPLLLPAEPNILGQAPAPKIEPG